MLQRVAVYITGSAAVMLHMVNGIESRWFENVFRLCVAVCCSMLQRVAMCCRVVNGIEGRLNMTVMLPFENVYRWVVAECVVVCCSELQCVAVCCSVLQCVAVCCSVCTGGLLLSVL